MSNIAVVSDQPVLLRGFACVLENRGFGIAVSCSGTGFAEAIAGCAAPDLLLLDLTAGLTFGNLTDIHTLIPDCPIVLWADSLPLEVVFKTLEFGVRGIVQRTSQPDQLAESLRKVARGEMQIGFSAPREFAHSRRKASLTPRERQIVALLRLGLRNKQIAAEMNITEGTVKIYLFRLFHKMGVRNRFELARCATIPQVPFPPGQASRREDAPISPLN